MQEQHESHHLAARQLQWNGGFLSQTCCRNPGHKRLETTPDARRSSHPYPKLAMDGNTDHLEVVGSIYFLLERMLKHDHASQMAFNSSKTGGIKENMWDGCLTFWYFDLQLKVSKVTEPPRKQTKKENKNKNIQTKVHNNTIHTTSHWKLLGSRSLSEICFKRSGVKRWTLAFKRGTVAACRSGMAEEELFGKWESSISISTSAGNSMGPRGVAGRWDIDISDVVLFSLVNL